MLDDMIDGAENCSLTSLNHYTPLEIGFGQTSENRVRFSQHRLESGKQVGSAATGLARKLLLTVSLERLAPDAADDPFGDIAGKMDDQIADAVRSRVRSAPDCGLRKSVNAVTKLDRVLLHQPVPRPGDEAARRLRDHDVPSKVSVIMPVLLRPCERERLSPVRRGCRERHRAPAPPYRMAPRPERPGPWVALARASRARWRCLQRRHAPSTSRWPRASAR